MPKAREKKWIESNERSILSVSVHIVFVILNVCASVQKVQYCLCTSLSLRKSVDGTLQSKVTKLKRACSSATEWVVAVINGNFFIRSNALQRPHHFGNIRWVTFYIIFVIHSTLRVPFFSLMWNIQIRASEKFCMSPNYWDATNSQLFDGLFGLRVSNSAHCARHDNDFFCSSNSLHIQINL